MGAPRAGVPRGSGTEPAAQELDPRRHRAKRVYLAPTQRLTSTCGYQQLTSTPIAVMRELARTQCQPPSGAAFAEPGAGLGLVWCGPLGAATMVERGSSRGQMPRQAWTGWCTEAQGGGRGQEKGLMVSPSWPFALPLWKEPQLQVLYPKPLWE